MKTIKKDYTINASVEKVWEALVNPKVINEWGGGPAVMDDKENSKFTLWGGEIHGSNIRVIRNKQLKQEWFGGKWDKMSIVTFKLVTKGRQTLLQLIHIDVPDREHKGIDEGWDSYYLGPLKELLEQNAV